MSPAKKCLVWDLDNTLWDGVLLEGEVSIRPEARQAIEELDRRGVLHSIASRGEREAALEVLRAAGLAEYFLAPQINWEPKPKSILAISRALRLALEAIVFIDDDRFELEQVGYMLPEVMTIEAGRAKELLELPAFQVAQLTPEAGLRRQYYLAEQRRQSAQSGYPDRRAFLRSCAMQLTVRPAAAGDVPRVLELMSRTHQLNTVGRVLPRAELLGLLQDPEGRFAVRVADLRDRFGSYGTVGTAVMERSPGSWRLQLLAVSCRVLGRGVERALLATLLAEAGRSGPARAEALFRDSGRNRAMLALYQMMGFRRLETRTEDGAALYRLALDRTPAAPSWIEVS